MCRKRCAGAPRNKLGFALQLCVLRYPGRLLAPGEFVPPTVMEFIGRQLDLNGYELADYGGAVRDPARASCRAAPAVRIPVLLGPRGA